MPYEEDEARRAARERLQARMARRGSSDTLGSSSSAGGSRPGSRISSRRSERQSNSADRESFASRIKPSAQDRSESDEYDFDEPEASGGSRFDSIRESVGDFFTTSGDNRTVAIGPISFDLPFDLPDRIPPIAVPIAALVIVLLLIFAVLIPSCTRAAAPAEQQQVEMSTEQTGSNGSTEQSATSQTSTVQQVADAKKEAEAAVKSASSVEGVDKQESHQAALVELLGDETSAKLLAEAKTSIDALWIAAHPDEYAFDGVEVQYKVLKLAADEPQALTYVREFPDSYPADGVNMDKSVAMSTSSPAAGVPDTNVPHLYQWDRRWGYTTYSSAAFGLTGCGPTSLAMVYQGLTGSNDKSPYDIAKIADERGYMDEYQGTVGTFFTEIAGELGLECEEIYPDSGSIRQALEHGQVVIANLAPGYFTANGHYFVLAGLADDGTAIVNDPYSVERSSQTWDLDTIASQSYACYGYTRSAAGATTTTTNTDDETGTSDAAEADTANADADAETNTDSGETATDSLADSAVAAQDATEA